MRSRRITRSIEIVAQAIAREACNQRSSDLAEVDRAVRELAEILRPCFARREMSDHLVTYLSGLLLCEKGKSLAAIARRKSLDRRALQRFLGQSDWPWEPVYQLLADRVADAIAAPDGVLVLRPRAVEKRGSDSVGVARQRCDDRGTIRNCQLSVELGYVSHTGVALIDGAIYLPECWTESRARCDRAGVPRTVEHATLSDLALELAARTRLLPYRLLIATTKLFEPLAVRRLCRDQSLAYLIRAPRETRVAWSLQRRPDLGKRPTKVGTVSDAIWDRSVLWQRVDADDANDRTVDAATIPVAMADGASASDDAETLLAIREYDDLGPRTSTYLTSAPADIPISDLVRAVMAPCRLDEYIRRAISHTGLTAYEVRTWRGWHHHHALALVAAWIDQSTLRRY